MKHILGSWYAMEAKLRLYLQLTNIGDIHNKEAVNEAMSWFRRRWIINALFLV